MFWDLVGLQHTPEEIPSLLLLEKNPNTTYYFYYFCKLRCFMRNCSWNVNKDLTFELMNSCMTKNLCRRGLLISLVCEQRYKPTVLVLTFHTCLLALESGLTLIGTRLNIIRVWNGSTWTTGYLEHGVEMYFTISLLPCPQDLILNCEGTCSFH